MKFTRRAKLLVVALVLCFTAMIGSTVAWFTDEVTSANNVITSGNLDMLVQYKTNWDDEWANLDEETKLFKEGAFYEPGYTETVFLRVANAGNLAFKYRLSLSVEDTVIGKSVLDNDIKLSDYLEVGIYSQDEYRDAFNYTDILMPVMFSTREDALKNVSSMTKLNVLDDNGLIMLANDCPVLAGDTTAQVIALVLTMPTTVGNEANHNGKAPEIKLGLQVEATQLVDEKDSFGPDYDKDALYPGEFVVSTSEELVNAFNEGGNITLAADIVLDEPLYLAEGDEVYLDLNGKTITANDTAVDPVFYTYKDSTLTIAGNGKVEIKEPSVSLIFPGGDVVIENGTFVRNVPAGTPANQVGAFFVGAKVSPWGSQTVTINGGYFDGGYYNKDAADIEEILAGTKSLEETDDDIAKRGNSKDANKVRVALKQNVQLTLNLSYNLIKVYGGTFVGMNPAWGDEGCMLPTTPNYLRPWSYYQGALLDGQTFHEDGIVLPDGYEITKGTTDDGRPTYTVNYNK